MTPIAGAKKLRRFDPNAFLSTVDGGRTTATFSKNQLIFVQATRPILFFIFRKAR